MSEDSYVQQPEDGEVLPVLKYAPRHGDALELMAAFTPTRILDIQQNFLL